MDNSEFFSPSTESQTAMNIELLGYPKQSGAMCEVCRVRRFGKQLMMKRLLPCHATIQQYQFAFRKEFEIGYLLEHQNLVRYYEWGEDEQGPFILMEYIDGWTLREFLTELPDYFDNIENEREFIKQILSVLGYLHSHQIVYLDLKPDNILITRIGRKVKLIDLGCCYSDTFTDTAGLNQNFSAPEQRSTTQGPHFSPQTDLYALGSVLRWMAEFPSCHLSTSAERLTKRLLVEQIEKRPLSTEAAWQIYQQKTHFQRSFLIIFCLTIAAIALYLLQSSPETTIVTMPTIEEAQIPSDTLEEGTMDIIAMDSVGAEKQIVSEPIEKPTQTEEASALAKKESPATVKYLLNARMYIAEEVDDGREETHLFIHEIDSVLQSFYGSLALQFTPLTLDNYQDFIDRRMNFGFEFRHIVSETSSKYGISTPKTQDISQTLYEAWEMAETDRLFIFLSENGLVRE